MAAILLRWLPSLEPGVTDYKVYAGRAPGVHDAPGSPKSMGNVTSGTFDINDDGDWFFAVSVVVTGRGESPKSAEIPRKFLTPRTP